MSLPAPYYQDSSVTLFHADWREIIECLPKEQAALICDPPYGIGYVHGGGGNGKHPRRNKEPVHGDDRPFEPAPWLNRWENIIFWGADHFSERLPHGRFLAWDKLNGLESFDSFSDVEFAWHSRRGASRVFRYLWKGICQAGEKEGGREHPTQKPVCLMRWCIEQAGLPAIVVDPFAGIGPTLIAAKELGLRAVGVEIVEEYCEVAARRLSQEFLPFEDAAARRLQQEVLAL